MKLTKVGLFCQKITTVLIVVSLCFGAVSPLSAGNGDHDCLLKMVYKEGDKEPLIAEKPDNSGAYWDLFHRAARKIGCELTVIRLPKKRLHKALERGLLDFYPGASFSQKRARYLYYIENGLDTAEHGVTALNIPEITTYQQVKKFNLTWLMELNSSKREIAKQFGISTHRINFADLIQLRAFLRQGRRYFYVADKELIDYYPKKTGRSLTETGLKIHKNCCGGDSPMRLGFSRSSHHFREQPNPDFDENKTLSPTNFPTMLIPGSIPHQLEQALQSMKESGETEAIYKNHFSDSD